MIITNNNAFSGEEEIPPLNCPDATCENPDSHYEWIFFPQNFTEPCPDCDFSVYVRYDICPGPPLTMHLEIIGTTDIDYANDNNTCDLCDFRDLHVHMVLRLLQHFAQTKPTGTIISYREKACWVQLKYGPVGGYPPGAPPPNPPAKSYQSAPCPGECCKYIFETFNGGSGWGISLINEHRSQNIECPKKGQFGLPRDCKMLCEPYAWWNEKVSTGGDFEQKYSVISYPNPASTKITFKISGIEKGFHTFSVYDLNGVELSKVSLNSDGTINHSIDINDYDSGYYQYQIMKDGNLVQTKSFIINK